MMSETAPQTSDSAAVSRRISLMLIGLGLLLTAGIILLLYMRLLPTGVPGQWQWPWRPLDHICPPILLLIPLLYAIPVGLLLRAISESSCGVSCQPFRHDGGPAAGSAPPCGAPVPASAFGCGGSTPQLEGSSFIAARSRGRTHPRGQTAIFVAICCLCAAGTMLVLESTEPVPPLHLATTIASVPATGYFSYATALDGLGPLMQTLSGRDVGAPPMPSRVGTHPPGPVVYYFLGLRVLESFPLFTYNVEQWLERTYRLTPGGFYSISRHLAMPSVQPYHLAPAFILGLILTLLGALLPLPAYFVGQELHSRRAGLAAALSAAAVPSLTTVIPSIDGFAAVLALTAVALGVWALRSGRLWLYGLCGLALVAAGLWSLGLLAVAIALLVAAVAVWNAQRRQVLMGLAAAAGTFILIHLLMYLIAGYSLIGNARTMMRWQSDVMAETNRDYLTWLPGNLWEVMLFMGPALLMTACAALPMWRRLEPPARWYAAGAFLAVAVVWLSGSTLGEVGRIWLFLMALLVPVAGMALVELPLKTSRGLLVAVMAAQVLLMVMLHCRLMLVHA